MDTRCLGSIPSILTMNYAVEKETVFSIGDILAYPIDVPKSVLPLTKKEQRTILVQEIYNYYKAEYDMRRKENWKRYVLWLKTNRINEKTLGREETWKKFSKTKNFIKEITLKQLAILISYIPTEDLPYWVSTRTRVLTYKKKFWRVDFF